MSGARRLSLAVSALRMCLRKHGFRIDPTCVPLR